MPYDKEIVDKAKKLGVFEKSIDAEALKTDEKERQKLAEKLKKSVSSTVGPQMSAQGDMELIELPVRREETIEIELSLWDRIVMFILSLFGLMSSSDYKKGKALRKIEQKLKKIKPSMIDFSRGYLSGEFGRVILSLYDHAKALRNVFEIFLNNENFWKGIGVEKSSCEYLFEMITDLPNVVERYKEVSSDDFLSRVVDKAQSTKSAIRVVEEEINGVLKLVPDDLIKRADNLFNNIVKLREFAYFDFETIVRKFTQVSEVKKGKMSFKSISPQGLINHIRDLESILLSLDVDDTYTAHYVKVMVEYIEKYAPSEKVNEIKSKLDQNFFASINENIRKLNIVDLVAYISKDPNHKPFIIKSNYSLFKEFSKIILDRYKRMVIKMMEDKNNKLIDKYMNIIFGKSVEIQEYGIYSSGVNSLFSKYGLPPFLYTKLLGIVVYFIKNVWDSYLKDVINTLVVSGSFSEKQLQRSLSELLTKIEPVKTKMYEFVRAVEQGGEYYVLLSRFISTPSLLANESNKKVVERKIIIMNGVCFEFLNAFKDIFRGIYKILSFVAEDIYAPFPKIVTNIHKIGGVGNRDFLDNIEKSVEKVNAFSSLINLFVEE